LGCPQSLQRYFILGGSVPESLSEELGEFINVESRPQGPSGLSCIIAAAGFF
jgi:hypothetical protein